MRRASSAKARVIGVCLCALLLTAGGFAAAVRQSAPTEAEYGPLMTEIRFTVGDAELHVDSRYWPETREDLDKLVDSHSYHRQQPYYYQKQLLDHHL